MAGTPTYLLRPAAPSVRPTRFTARQREVALGIAAGLSNEEIGRHMGISARTVKAHADALRLKLGVDHRRRIPLAYQRASGEALFDSAADEPVPDRP